jgi:hypothetical protein
LADDFRVCDAVKAALNILGFHTTKKYLASMVRVVFNETAAENVIIELTAQCKSKCGVSDLKFLDCT